MKARTTRATKAVLENRPEQSGQLDLPLGDNQPISPDQLLLDTGNLRLLERGRQLLTTPAMEIGQPAIQKRVEQALRETKAFDVQGLAVSIGNNSFLQHE